jgi:hypothetical protein
MAAVCLPLGRIVYAYALGAARGQWAPAPAAGFASLPQDGVQ